MWRQPRLSQFRVLGFRFSQDGDVGVGVFPEGEEVLIRENPCQAQLVRRGRLQINECLRGIVLADFDSGVDGREPVEFHQGIRRIAMRPVRFKMVSNASIASRDVA